MASSAECQPCPYPSQSRSHHSALTVQELDTGTPSTFLTDSSEGVPSPISPFSHTPTLLHPLSTAMECGVRRTWLAHSQGPPFLPKPGHFLKNKKSGELPVAPKPSSVQPDVILYKCSVLPIHPGGGFSCSTTRSLPFPPDLWPLENR